jgi:hypothetical protein
VKLIDPAVKHRFKSKVVEQSFVGLKRCYHCSKYYELGVPHMCFKLGRDKGKARMRSDARILERMKDE